jgi:anti-sigma factor RsiW
MKKECRYIQKKLSACQDGELDSAEKAAVESHLHSCRECRSRYEALTKAYQMIGSLPEIEPGHGFLKKILDQTAQSREPYWVRGIRLAQKLLPMPAAMAALAVSGILIGAVSGNVLIKKWVGPTMVSSAFDSSRSLTLSSINAFEAIPPGSFADEVLRLAGPHKEVEHEK